MKKAIQKIVEVERLRQRQIYNRAVRLALNILELPLTQDAADKVNHDADNEYER